MPYSFDGRDPLKEGEFCIGANVPETTKAAKYIIGAGGCGLYVDSSMAKQSILPLL